MAGWGLSGSLSPCDEQRQPWRCKGGSLRLEVRTFSDATDQFIEWAKGEHHSKPQTWKRLRGSMTSLKEFFKKQPLQTIA